MNINTKKPNKYFIEYSNQLDFVGRKLAFRKGFLFDITATPTFIKFNKLSNCWIVNRCQLTISKAKELTKKEPIKVDVSDMQWYRQIELQECFNL
jgi:hypothetical protein